MTNPKGTFNETATAKWMRLNGFPMADRKVKRGNRDEGDLNLAPGLIAEVKAYRLPTGTPTAGQLDTWLAQSETERRNSGAAYCPLIVKRPGTTDVGRWFAYLPAAQFAILTGAFLPRHVDDVPVMLPVDAMALVFRASGFGVPLEDEE